MNCPQCSQSACFSPPLQPKVQLRAGAERVKSRLCDESGGGAEYASRLDLEDLEWHSTTSFSQKLHYYRNNIAEQLATGFSIRQEQ